MSGDVFRTSEEDRHVEANAGQSGAPHPEPTVAPPARDRRSLLRLRGPDTSSVERADVPVATAPESTTDAPTVDGERWAAAGSNTDNVWHEPVTNVP